MKKDKITNLGVWSAAILIVTGVAFIHWAIGIIVAGILLLLITYLYGAEPK